MSANNYNFSEDQLNRLFPFHFILNENLEIISSGKSIKKLLGFTDGIPFDQILYIKRPELEITNFEDLRNNFNHLLIIGSKTHNTFMLRCQIEPLEGDKIIFAGTPWFYSVEEVKSSKLTLNDFLKLILFKI